MAVVLLSLLVSCATAPREPPATTPAAQTGVAQECSTPTELIQAIGAKVRGNLELPAGSFPPSTKVTLKMELSSDGWVRELQIDESSGYAAIDQAVKAAVKKSEPLPVLASLRAARKSLALKIVFLPFSK